MFTVSGVRTSAPASSNIVNDASEANSVATTVPPEHLVQTQTHADET